jgi:hypothetical protein
MNRHTLRTLLMVLLLLTGGAIINVVVAWGILIQQSRHYAHYVDSLPVGYTTYSGTDEDFAAMMRDYRSSTGFPIPSMQRELGPKLEFLNSLWRNGFKLDKPRWAIGERVRLPVRPLWPGFTINTIFYAAILWLLFAVLRPGERPFRRLAEMLHGTTMGRVA